MKKAYVIINGKIYIRLTKLQAQSLYDTGITITFYPENYGEGYYQNLSAYHMNKELTNKSFDECLSWYISQYCYDYDTGKNANFYIEIAQNERG